MRNVAFNGIKNLKLAIGVKNLFDKDPPLFIPTSNQFQAGYDASRTTRAAASCT